MSISTILMHYVFNEITIVNELSSLTATIKEGDVMFALASAKCVESTGRILDGFPQDDAI